MGKLTPYEYDVLRHLNGEETEGQLVWGAAMSAVIDYLRNTGMVARYMKDGAIEYEITQKGRDYLKFSSRP